MSYYIFVRSFGLFFLLSIHFLSKAQCDTNRYRSSIFNQVYVHNDVQYGVAPAWNIPYSDTELYMDIYEPIGDTQQLRPLMIWVHPGAFLTGDKTAEDMVALCDSFARRGYVTVSLGYRLGYNPLSSESAERAVYRGTQDVRAAIRYMYEFAPIYQVDTNYTLVGGSSAGGFSALHLAFLDDDEAPASIAGGTLSPDLGCLDCSGNNYVHDVDVDAIVNMWGALGDTSWIDTNEHIPTLLIHGTNDGVIPFDTGNPFGLITTPIVYGSNPINERLNNAGIDHELLAFYGEDHEPHGTSNGDFGGQNPTPYWDTIINAVSNHYLKVVTPPAPLINGSTDVCEGELVTFYAQSPAAHFCWTVNGGSIVNNWNDSIEVLWNAPGTNGAVSLIAKNQIGGASKSISTPVIVHPLPNPTFVHSVNQSTVNFQSTTAAGNQIEWDFGDGNTSNQENPSHTYTTSGTYLVTLTETSSEGCIHSFQDSINVLDLASISNLDKPLFTMYPNPVKTKLHIQDVKTKAECTVLDALGVVVFTKKLQVGDNAISMQNVAPGVYHVIVKTHDVATRQKIIVHR